MGINRLVIGTAVGVAVLGGTMLIGGAAADAAGPTPSPDSTAAPSQLPSTPVVSAVPSPVATVDTPGAVAIEVPAGNAGVPKHSAGTATSIEIAGLIGLGGLAAAAGAGALARRRG
jgi:hypothetical protein